MKYLLFGFCLAVAFSARVFGMDTPPQPPQPVEVEGVIKADTTWSGRVLVVGDVLVPEGVTLTIEPGTCVRFAQSDSTKIEPMFLSMQTELLVRGILLVNGKATGPVWFEPSYDPVTRKVPECGDWGGLIFDGVSASKSVVKRAVIEKADTAVSAYNSSPTIEGCRIADSRYGLVAADGAAPVLSGCRIVGGEFGVVTYRGSKPALDGCTFERNEHDFLTRD
ncbi:MAG: right-handed parallel beta-helix repeat-containing protein [Nitrospirae bacterium]|nr:right-handed parallel beta-helix repeat-containing protein [Nitrospirota bacterium]